MDGISSKLTELLQNPGMMEQIRGLAAAFGQSGTNASAPTGAEMPFVPPMQNAQVSQPTQNVRPNAPMGGIPPEMSGWMLRLLPMMGAFQQETDETRFLCALRPLLSEERQKKLDGALQLMKAMKVLPLLRQGGLLS